LSNLREIRLVKQKLKAAATGNENLHLMTDRHKGRKLVSSQRNHRGNPAVYGTITSRKIQMSACLTSGDLRLQGTRSSALVLCDGDMTTRHTQYTASRYKIKLDIASISPKIFHLHWAMLKK